MRFPVCVALLLLAAENTSASATGHLRKNNDEIVNSALADAAPANSHYDGIQAEDESYWSRIVQETLMSVEPTAAPVTVPPPSNLPQDYSCEPSIGYCADNYAVLNEISQSLTPGDTIAICGTIFMEEAITISVDDVTLCCDDDVGNSRCILQSGGNGRNLIVTGANPEIQGLAFEGGATDDGNGGNVLLDARGDIVISQSAFTSGNAVYGGNLHIQNADSVIITNSRFELGTANFGGGVSIQNTPTVTIEESYFDSNRCGSQGGGLLVYAKNEFSQADFTVSMTLNRFTSNGADRGGGFFLRNLGNILTLRMTESYFEDNGAAVQGGAGLVRLLPDTTLDAVLTGNIGQDNVAVLRNCTGILFNPFPNIGTGFDCRSVNEDISY